MHQRHESHHKWYQLTRVKGWWSAIRTILPWSGLGGQPLTSSSRDQGLLVNHQHHRAVISELLVSTTPYHKVVHIKKCWPYIAVVKSCFKINIFSSQAHESMKTNNNKSSNPCQGLSLQKSVVTHQRHRAHHAWYQLTMVRGWWSAISSISLRSGISGQRLTSSSRDEGPERKRREKTQRETHRQKTHGQKTQRENTERKHREKTQREKTQREKNTERKTRRQKTPTENTERKHTEKTQRQKTQTKKHRQKTQRGNAERKHRQKTHRQKTETHREKTQRENTTENTDRKHTDRKRKHTERKHRQKYDTILQSTTQYYYILQSTTCYDSVLHSATQYSMSEPGTEPRTSCFQG